MGTTASPGRRGHCGATLTMNVIGKGPRTEPSESKAGRCDAKAAIIESFSASILWAHGPLRHVVSKPIVASQARNAAGAGKEAWRK